MHDGAGALDETFHTSKMGEHMSALVDKTKGKIKQAVGNLTGDKKLEREGKRDQRKGQFESAIDDVKDAVKETQHAFEDAVK